MLESPLMCELVTRSEFKIASGDVRNSEKGEMLQTENLKSYVVSMPGCMSSVSGYCKCMMIYTLVFSAPPCRSDPIHNLKVKTPDLFEFPIQHINSS
jgi:hypothetical protein